MNFPPKPSLCLGIPIKKEIIRVMTAEVYLAEKRDREGERKRGREKEERERGRERKRREKEEREREERERGRERVFPELMRHGNDSWFYDFFCKIEFEKKNNYKYLFFADTFDETLFSFSCDYCLLLGNMSRA